VDPIVALSRAVVDTCAQATASMVAQVTTMLKVDPEFRKKILAPGVQNIIDTDPQPEMFTFFEEMIRQGIAPVLDDAKREAALAMRTACYFFLLHVGQPDLAEKVRAFEYPFTPVAAPPAST